MSRLFHAIYVATVNYRARQNIRQEAAFMRDIAVAEFIRRCVHYVEKALSLQNVRLGYGHSKVECGLGFAVELLFTETTPSREAINW